MECEINENENDILIRFKLTDCKAVSAPLSSGQRLVDPERKLYTTREFSFSYISHSVDLIQMWN